MPDENLYNFDNHKGRTLQDKHYLRKVFTRMCLLSNMVAITFVILIDLHVCLNVTQTEKKQKQKNTTWAPSSWSASSERMEQNVNDDSFNQKQSIMSMICRLH